jgi:hypothetical protein
MKGLKVFFPVSLPFRRFVVLTALMTLSTVRLVLGSDASTISFNQHIRPILSDKCFACHGLDAHTREADLRLDVAEDAVADRGGTRAIVPGNPEESLVWQRIISSDPDEQMPPADSHKQLSDDEKELIRRWIAAGATYQKHWAYEAPVASDVPKTSSAVTNPIDAFVRQRLEAEGLEAAPEADRRTLIRRVAFALTGLPPTRDEMQRYLIDRSPKAYERMVERYLQSPHYGEEMARHWLDVARYADTHGMHLDNERQTWAYRDWVVNAFNRNLPFDQFTIEQLAGDLLPDPTLEQLTATGFNRCNVTTSEGGSIDAELLFRYAVDRASTTVQAWMGLTAGCAVCHDHKFDPISQKEFYSLYAFFYSAADPAMDGNALLTQPVLKLEMDEHRARRVELASDAQRAQAAVDSHLATIHYTDPETSDVQESLRAWWTQTAGTELPGVSTELNSIVKQGPDAVTDPEQRRQVEVYYLQHVCRDTKDGFAPLLAEVVRVKEAQAALENSIPSTFVFRDLPEPRQSFVMIRGAYDKPGEPVEPNVPAVLPPLTKSQPSAPATRLDLAQWLVSENHPLTARVTVNRFWQQFFGAGLVKSSYDFGSQGELPSHPELLDWLAVHFRTNGWDVHDLVRMIITSATFRQDSRVTPEMLARDPANRFYARGPRLRLDAEQIRDNALFVSGLMELEMGGKGVKPYQPENIWEPVGFAGSNTRFYQQDHGSALYRRSLYTFLKRTAPPPFMANFDAPNREQFCTLRERSNTPLQALQLMNDVQHIEAARHLAVRMLHEGGLEATSRLEFAFEAVLGRPPLAGELEIVHAQLKQHLARYSENEQAAEALLAHGESPRGSDRPATELAAYTLVANMLLNLDETLTRN